MSRKYTEKQLKEIHRRSIVHMQLSWNYERMQGLGYLTSILPVLEDSYKDNPEMLKRALRNHVQFFHTEAHMADVIVGVNVAIEEESGSDDVISTSALIKSSLMGPFMAVGDTIFKIILPVLVGGMAIDFSMNGSYFGLLILVAYSLFILFVIRPLLFKIGYMNGTRAVKNMKTQLASFSDAASVLGVTVIGAMIALFVDVEFGGIRTGVKETLVQTNAVGELVEVPSYFPNLNFQVDIFDKIMPHMGAVLLVGISYYLLKRKKATPNKLIFAILIFCLIVALIAEYTVFELLV